MLIQKFLLTAVLSFARHHIRLTVLIRFTTLIPNNPYI